MSKASSSFMFQITFGEWAVVLRNIPKTPLIKFAKPLCSLSIVSFASSFMVINGFLIAKALSINSEPSHVKPVFLRISSATLFVASKTV